MVPDMQPVVGCGEYLVVEDFDNAIESANVALAGSVTSDQPVQRFELLVCRGAAHTGAEKLQQAERDYREALRIAEKNFDPFDQRLVDPLTHLGRLRLAAEDIDDAELFLLRAKDITHRTAGIYNVQQDEVLKDLSEVFLQQNRLQQADRHQALRLQAARETYGETPELIEALHNYARWNASIERFPKVRVALDEAVTILEDSYGVNDPRLIETLKLRARLYKQHPTIVAPAAAEEAMQRVVDIYASQPFVDQVDLLKARTDVGDFYIRGLDRTNRKAIRYYKKTVKQARAANVDPKLIDDFYGVPTLLFINTARMSFYGRDEKGELLQGGTITVRYDVGKNGKTRNVRVIEDTLDNPVVTDDIIGRAHSALFRPKFVNGKLVVARNLEQRFDIRQTGSGLEVSKIHPPVYGGQ